MTPLVAKIEANAAKRLPLPPTHRPAQELARYRTFLKVETHRLKILHRAGASGREVCRARATVLDVLVRYVLEAVRAAHPAADDPAALALVAIGGYGRAELSPCSDIDLMFLHDGSLMARGQPLERLTQLVEGLLYTLYDIGLKVGHSVRSLEDCVKVANSDMQSKTSLIEARLITGSEKLFHRMQKVVLDKCVKGHEREYIAARLADQATRRSKYGNSALMQEPNIKNGCGGLRDFQNLLWMTLFKYRVRSLTELEDRGLINASERKQLDAAYDFLLRARNELHYHVEKPIDVVSKSVQPAIAYNLGYQDRSPVKRLEKFMGDYYTHSRNIHLITRTLEQRLALLPLPKQLPTLGELLRDRRHRAQYQIDGFKFIDGEIHPGSTRVFREQPRRLMRVFLHAQKRGLRLHPDLVQLIRHDLALVNRAFVTDPHVHETFLEILNQRGNVAPVLRAMHEVGFLGKYLPEFGKLTCLVQHEFYHQYTADEHTLVCLEKLDQIWDAPKPPYQNYTQVFQELERPFVLYLALLLHDTGKAAHTGKHAVASGLLAHRVAKRLGLDASLSQLLLLLVEHHLLMAQTSQRRDLEDPAVIRQFAAIVKTPEQLTQLLLLTFADSQGTSASLWNDFKESLLWSLYHKAKALLAGGTEFIRAEARQRESLAGEVHRLLAAAVSEEEVQAHFANLPARYYQIHSAAEIARHLDLVHRFLRQQLAEDANGLEPAIAWHGEPDRGYSAVTLCTWNRTGLFSKFAGSFSAAGLNILSAQIFSRGDGIILDTFFVCDARTGKLPTREAQEKFARLVNGALTGPVDFAALIARQSDAATRYQAHLGERIPTAIRFDNASSETRTVIDVETEDRVGLLHVVSQALAEHGVDISVAKISTEKGAAIDTFYVSEADGSKVLHPQRLKLLEQKLLAAVKRLDEA